MDSGIARAASVQLIPLFTGETCSQFVNYWYFWLKTGSPWVGFRSTKGRGTPYHTSKSWSTLNIFHNYEVQYTRAYNFNRRGSKRATKITSIKLRPFYTSFTCIWGPHLDTLRVRREHFDFVEIHLLSRTKSVFRSPAPFLNGPGLKSKRP